MLELTLPLQAAGMEVVDVETQEASSVKLSPYGSVGVVHSGTDLKAWWVWKSDEEIEPTWAVVDREDLLYIIKGSLRLDLDGGESHVLRAGEAFVIPAGTRFRGYSWPRDTAPCLFLAVAPAEANFTRL
jgi:mannose-6-phosphate isomerase-like protein (cupin superfamily)